MVICLELGVDLHMAQLMPLPLTVSCFRKIQTGLPFWYRLTRVVREKGPLNGRVCVCVCLCVYVCLSVCDHIFGTTRPIFAKFVCVFPMADQYLLPAGRTAANPRQRSAAGK